MVTSKATSVAKFLKAHPPETAATLTTLCKLVRKVAPRALESMQYGMPSWFQNGPLFAVNAQKNYFALYCCEVDLVAKHQATLGRVDCGMSCVRFRKLEQLDLAAVKQMLEAAVARRDAGGVYQTLQSKRVAKKSAAKRPARKAPAKRSPR